MLRSVIKNLNNCDMLITGKSSICGKGLFTDTPIPARMKIGEFTGESISVREGRRRAKGAKRIAIVEVSATQAIDGNVKGGPFNFINHSCDSNVFIRVAYGRAEFYARRNIKAGDELTCDYVDSHHEGKLPCRCGSPKCRKFI
jgi:SET domain-containing protein